MLVYWPVWIFYLLLGLKPTVKATKPPIVLNVKADLLVNYLFCFISRFDGYREDLGLLLS